MKAISKIDLILAENPGKNNKTIKVTDEYLQTEVLSYEEEGSNFDIKKGDLTVKLKSLNEELSLPGIKNIEEDRLLALLEKAEIADDDKIGVIKTLFDSFWVFSSKG